MNKKLKTVLLLIIALISISTTVGAATIFNSKDITYSSSATTKTNVKESLDELYEKLGECPNGYGCYKLTGLASKVELGDYIKMTPKKTRYTISKELTGYESDQTINPSELNLWRVIKKNDDGTVDAVSHYISSKMLYFGGKTGFMNCVGVLNAIASQYTNTEYVEDTRYFGYSNQTEYLEDSESLSSLERPWDRKTISTRELTECDYNVSLCGEFEKQGGGDTGWMSDLQALDNIYGNFLSQNVLGYGGKGYWVSGRMYSFSDEIIWQRGVKSISETGFNDWLGIYSSDGDSFLNEIVSGKRLRPVITFKSSLKLEQGDGKSEETAYQLE